MCGINGIIGRNNQRSNKVFDSLKAMNELIIHRGPDDDGFFQYSGSKYYQLGMAMRRLAIIDLNAGKQPISSDDGNLTIVFNGEIYNYKSLRTKLLNEGIKFKTQSDTEVILKLYEKFGIESFTMLDGMFAFSIFDKTLNKVFIARDFFGEKPLYYHKNNEKFLWASELKSIKKILSVKPSINKEALNIFLQLTYIPAPFTIYEGISKLEANHYIEFDCENFHYNVVEIEQDKKKYSINNKTQAIHLTRELVQQSVVSRSIADVNLGTFLSGGVDSSIISLCLANSTEAKIDTFSIGFDKKSFDETDKSRLVAKQINSNHHEFIIKGSDLTKDLDQIILNFDEPFADSSALASYVLAKKTKDYVKVALTGDGGDEIFGGYNKYYIGKLNETYTSKVPENAHTLLSRLVDLLASTKNDQRGKRFKLKRLMKAINYEGNFYYNIISLGFQEDELKHLLNPNAIADHSLTYFKNKIGAENSTVKDFRNIDKIMSLEGDMIVKVDRTSMLTSLESRSPFLNKELFNFTSQLPESYLINGYDKKHILKESFKEFFPNKFLNKAKKGFNVPVGDWLRTDLKSELLSFIDSSFLEKQDIFNLDLVSKLVYNHLNNKVDNTFRVWTFYCFQKWYINIYGL